MRQANSVKIAKIIAGAIIISTFMLGCFILGGQYIQNHAVCDQIRSLEDALDKEMMLEIMSQVSLLYFFLYFSQYLFAYLLLYKFCMFGTIRRVFEYQIETLFYLLFQCTLQK